MERVLIVDDEENIRFSFGSILIDAGFDVTKAAGLIEAKNILATETIDVAIVDRLLESDDGMDLVEHINKIQPDCTSILVSAFPTFKSASKGFAHNLFAYLQKPVRKTLLCKVVKAAAQKARSRQESITFEKQLIQAQRMTTLGMLSSGIVHDFNNLFMVLSGYIDLINFDLTEKSPLIENLMRMQKVNQQGKNLSKQFLSFIKKEEQRPEPVQIQTLLKSSLSLLRIMLPKTIDITENIGDGDDRVLVQPAQIEQSIINIGLNAMHAMADKTGIIDLGLETVNLDLDLKCRLGMDKTPCVKISITDTGCGMDEDTLNQIFNPFFSTRPKSLGTGIGLSTTLKIIKDHRGSITADSRPAEGSSFFIYLPTINRTNN